MCDSLGGPWLSPWAESHGGTRICRLGTFPSTRSICEGEISKKIEN
jgi:hypothetical protein